MSAGKRSVRPSDRPTTWASRRGQIIRFERHEVLPTNGPRLLVWRTERRPLGFETKSEQTLHTASILVGCGLLEGSLSCPAAQVALVQCIASGCSRTGKILLLMTISYCRCRGTRVVERVRARRECPSSDVARVAASLYFQNPIEGSQSCPATQLAIAQKTARGS